MPIIRVLILALLFGAQAFPEGTRGVTWKSFDKGLKDASASRKYTFVDIYTEWCGYCRMLDNTTLKAKPVVAELEKNFVSTKFDAESAETITWKGKKLTKRDLAATWGVNGFPTLLFLNSKGDVIGIFPSYAEPELMIKLLTYISSGARERNVSFQDYLKKEPT